MHLNEQFFNVSAERLLKATRNVEFAKHMPLIAAATNESFADKIKRAIAARRGTRKQADEQAQRERSRYRKPERRERTKGE